MKHYVTVYGVVSPTTLSTGYLDEIIPVGPYDLEPFIPGKQVICLFGVENQSAEMLLKIGLERLATKESDVFAQEIMRQLANHGYAYYKENTDVQIGQQIECVWEETDEIMEASQILSVIMDQGVINSFFGELYMLGVNAGIRYAQFHPDPVMVN